MEKIEEKFVLGEISKELFEKFASKYQNEVKILSGEIARGRFESSNLEKAVEKCLEISQNLGGAWLSASFENKQLLQKLVFPAGILYSKENNRVRTIRTNTLFSEIEPLARVLAENKKGDSKKNRLKSSSVPRTEVFYTRSH
ncbi:MAG: hypothetical protein EOO46_20950 [Flavobacterium sp.]|nr:MAG: hypothetical protein EOO46_20950 [Flavobacterium sp.]